MVNKIYISNKTIVALVAIALVIMAVGTMVSISRLSSMGNQYTLLTGAVTDTGSTSLTVQGGVSVSVPDSAIVFPTGYYNASSTTNFSVLYATGTGGATADWINTSGQLAVFNDFHTIVNNGTTIINITADTNQTDARSFLCGTGNCLITSGVNASVLVVSTDSEVGSCASGTAMGAVLLSPTAETVTTLCNYLNYDDGSDSLTVYYGLHVPKDVDQGVKSMTITYTAEAR